MRNKIVTHRYLSVGHIPLGWLDNDHHKNELEKRILGLSVVDKEPLRLPVFYRFNRTGSMPALRMELKSHHQGKDRRDREVAVVLKVLLLKHHHLWYYYLTMVDQKPNNKLTGSEIVVLIS